ATLAAVARTNFDLADNITLHRYFGPNDYVFGVRLYTPNSQGVSQPVWINGPSDGSFYPTDLQSTYPNEYGPILFQRACLILPQQTGATFADMGQAFLTLTGQPYTYSAISSGDSFLPATLAADLNAGEPVVAGTRSDGPLILDTSGLIHQHAYTVLGIDSGLS